MRDKALFSKMLLDLGFQEEVHGKYIFYIHDDFYDEESTVEVYDRCAVWYIDSDDFYLNGRRVSYNKFREELEKLLGNFADKRSYLVTEDDLLFFLGAVADKIMSSCVTLHHVPPVLLETRLSKFKKYNDILRNNNADYYDDPTYEHLQKLISLKLEYLKS